MVSMLARMATAALALALVAGPVVLAVQGCEETSATVDGSVTVADVASARACGDVGPFGWVPESQKATAINDAGELATLFGVWGTDENAVWAVGTGGTVIHYDGAQWIRQKTPTDVTLTAVWGTTEKDVWAVGHHGTVIHYDGTEWRDQSPPLLVFHTADGGPPSGDAAAEIKRNLWGVWATGKVYTEALYAVGDNGTVIYFDGKNKLWSDKIPVTAAGAAVRIQDQLSGVWGASASKVYIVGNFGTVLEGTKAGLTVQKTGITKDLHAVWGRSNSDVYAVGTSGTVLHRGGGGWKALTGAPGQVLRGVWGPGNKSSTTYIVGWDGTLLRMTGGPTFSNGAHFDPFYCIKPGRRLEAIWGTLVPVTMFDGGLPPPTPVGDAGVPDLQVSPVDLGIPLVPLVWTVGASGTVIIGP